MALLDEVRDVFVDRRHRGQTQGGRDLLEAGRVPVAVDELADDVQYLTLPAGQSHDHLLVASLGERSAKVKRLSPYGWLPASTRTVWAALIARYGLSDSSSGPRAALWEASPTRANPDRAIVATS